MLPRFFLDRSLGDHLVPSGLRDASWIVVTMRERYGPATAQSLSDIDWITDAAREDEVMLTADKMIAKRPREAQTVIASGARVIALHDGRKTAAEQLALLIKETNAVTRAAQRRGPFVYSLSTRGLSRLQLNVGHRR